MGIYERFIREVDNGAYGYQQLSQALKRDIQSLPRPIPQMIRAADTPNRLRCVAVHLR